jgi:Family of unknown function (DUF6526)
MSDQTPQSYASHTRLDPPFHFFALPVMGITLVIVIWQMVKNPSFPLGWGVVFMLALIVVTVKARVYSLRMQDRVIRLEERLRFSMLLAEPLRARINELTVDQLIALRFASDGEIPSLVEKTLASNLPAAEIKKAIVTWRPDYLRI